MASTKKITKVQTPIDEKETFVSLQKTFADSELSVEEKLKVLYELQQADNEIEKIKQFRGELPEDVAALEAEVAKLSAKVEEISRSIEGYGQTIEAAQKDIESTEDSITGYEQQIKEISNSREYDSIEKEIENLQLEKMIAEKRIRESKEAIENAKVDISRIEEKIATREADLNAKKEELANIVESTSAQETKLQATREACAAKIDERTMSAYERIRTSVHNHLAVVPVFNESCGGCFNSVTPQRLIDVASGKKLVICEHCGRILVNAGSDTAKDE